MALNLNDVNLPTSPIGTNIPIGEDVGRIAETKPKGTGTKILEALLAGVTGLAGGEFQPYDRNNPAPESAGDYLNAVIKALSGEGPATAADYALAQSPAREPRGLGGVLSSFTRNRAGQRVAAEQLASRQEEDARKRAEAEQKAATSAQSIAESKAREQYYGAGVEQRQASAALSRSKVGVDRVLADVRQQAQRWKETMDPQTLEVSRRVAEARILQAEADLRDTENDLLKITDLDAREAAKRQLEQQKIDLQKARDEVDKVYKEGLLEVQKSRAASYATIAAAFGKNTKVTETEYTVTFTPEEGEPFTINKDQANMFESMAKADPAFREMLKERAGYKKGFLGFGASSPEIAVGGEPTLTKETVQTPIKPGVVTSATSGTSSAFSGPPVAKLNKDGSPTYFSNGQVWHLDLSTMQPVRDK